MNRIPSLDGLRAMSVALVIFGHQYHAIFGGRPPGPPIWNIFGNGNLGVEVFFVISGFLITTLLLQEHERYGSISLRNFYVRRVFRIFPALYAYVGGLALLSLVGAVVLTKADLFSVLSFTWNYSPAASAWALTHTWSLSVEEQFYLLWPAALVWLLARGNRRTATVFAGSLILIAPLLRLHAHFSGNEFLAKHIYFMAHTRMDALMFGCLAALLNGSDFLERVCRASSRYIPVIAVFVFGISIQLVDVLGGKYIYVVGYTLEGLSITLIMMYAVRNPNSMFGRVLNSRPLVHVGVLSYSLYLWQGLFLNVENHKLPSLPPFSIMCVFLMAELSYYFVEKPFLRMRSRFEAKRIPLRAQAAAASAD